MLDKTDDGNKIKIELVKSNTRMRLPCDVCGGCTERVAMVARGHDLLVCEFCLEAGDIDERLERRAARLEAAADETRALIGRLVVPSYAEWRAAETAENEDLKRYYRAFDTARNAEQVAIEHDMTEHDPKVSYVVTFRDGSHSWGFQTRLGAERFIAEYGQGEIKEERMRDAS